MGDGGVVTILVTDLVNSTELVARAGDESAQRIVRIHRRLLSDAVGGHGGDEVKWLGDRLMVAFLSAVDAVNCAIDMQRASTGSVEGETLASGVGMNAGEGAARPRRLLRHAPWWRPDDRAAGPREAGNRWAPAECASRWRPPKRR